MVDAPSVGATPDATSAPFTLTVTASPSLVVSEVSPWSSGDSPYAADWFELTNKGASAIDLAGWKVDDGSNALASAIALTGVSSIAPGESALFLEGHAPKVAAFSAFWSLAAGVQVGTYNGSGIGLSTDGDAVNLFDAGGARVAGVTFGVSTTYVTFDNSGPSLTLSVAGKNGARTVDGTTGSPGLIATRTDQATAGGGVTGLVPPQFGLMLGAPATFAPSIAGVAKDYTAATTATVTSTAGDAALSVADASAVAPGHDEVAIGLKQPIGAKDALRTGAYAKTLTFTLSTTTP
jgi:hypothetical protein